MLQYRFCYTGPGKTFDDTVFTFDNVVCSSRSYTNLGRVCHPTCYKRCRYDAQEGNITNINTYTYTISANMALGVCNTTSTNIRCFFILVLVMIIVVASFLSILDGINIARLAAPRSFRKAETRLEVQSPPTFTTTSMPRTSNVTTNKKIVILYWTKTFASIPPVNGNPKVWPFFYAGNNCPVECELTVDRKRVNEASALVIHARNIEEMPHDGLKNIPWLLHTNENPVSTSSLRDQRIMSKMNYLISYRLDSDFPCPGFVKPEMDIPVPFRDKKGLIIFVASHCEPVRTKYVSELMKHISVDAYGACLRNKQGLLRRESGLKGREAAIDRERDYKFALIFPNADCDYYITEKIYMAFSAGTVPVWMGTDTIDKVLQWGNLKHSYIKVNNFSSPEKLAKYLKFLAGNEEEYNKYLKWKYEGFNFPKEYYESPIGQYWDGLPLYCRVCMRIAVDPKGHDGIPVDRCDGEQARTARKWLGHD